MNLKIMQEIERIKRIEKVERNRKTEKYSFSSSCKNAYAFYFSSMYIEAIYKKSPSFDSIGLALFFLLEYFPFMNMLYFLFQGISNSMLFFFCSYFFCLLLSLAFLLHFSSACFNVTENVVVSGSSFVVCSFFMLLFYITTKESVRGKAINTIIAMVFFFILELFIIAILVILLIGPELTVEAVSAISHQMRSLYLFFACKKRKEPRKPFKQIISKKLPIVFYNNE